MNSCLIAETDEHGEVQWVWVHRRNRRAFTPVKDTREVLKNIDQFEIHGASQPAVVAWLNDARTCC